MEIWIKRTEKRNETKDGVRQSEIRFHFIAFTSVDLYLNDKKTYHDLWCYDD
jgi:hypothetical protein